LIQTDYEHDIDVCAAAYHEAGHVVAAVTQGLPLQPDCIHLSTTGVGIACIFQRNPGDLALSADDTEERERTIKLLKAGYLAGVRADPFHDLVRASDDRCKEQALLGEMYKDDVLRAAENERLKSEATVLVEKNWPAIDAIAKRVLALPLTARSVEATAIWDESEGPYERLMSGREIAEILAPFGLNVIVRDASNGTFVPEFYKTGI
jgi:hypothetical protein